jgi:hypothetical protein
LRDITFNLLKGNVTLTATQLARLKKHRRAVKLLAAKRTPLKQRVKVTQRGGFIGALLGPLLAGVATSALSRGF